MLFRVDLRKKIRGVANCTAYSKVIMPNGSQWYSSPPHMKIGEELQNTLLKISSKALSSPHGVQSMLKVIFWA